MHYIICAIDHPSECSQKQSYLFFANQQGGALEPQNGGFLWCHKEAIRGVQKFHLLIAHILKLGNQLIHVTIFDLAEFIVNGKDASPFEGSQGFQNNALPILTWDIVIAIVTGHSVKVFIREIQLAGIAGLLAPFLAMVLISDKGEYRANMGGTAVSAVVLLCLSCILYFGDDTISANGALYTITGTMALLVAIVNLMNIATSITIKKRIPGQIIGRVISMIQLCATISVPLGQLFFGFCADKLPVTISYLISAFGLVITFAVMIKSYRVIKCMSL